MENMAMVIVTDMDMDMDMDKDMVTALMRTMMEVERMKKQDSSKDCLARKRNKIWNGLY